MTNEELARELLTLATPLNPGSVLEGAQQIARAYLEKYREAWIAEWALNTAICSRGEAVIRAEAAFAAEYPNWMEGL
jgi:hypothetical protein